MMKQRKIRQTISIDTKIQTAKDTVEKAKSRYDKAVETLKALLDRRDEMQKKELMKAIADSDRTDEKILSFIKS